MELNFLKLKRKEKNSLLTNLIYDLVSIKFKFIEVAVN